jgi:hypothetical protein
MAVVLDVFLAHFPPLLGPIQAVFVFFAILVSIQSFGHRQRVHRAMQVLILLHTEQDQRPPAYVVKQGHIPPLQE